MSNLGDRIREIRKQKAISQVELESKTGIKREYLSKIENSELKNPTYNTLIRICEGLGVSLRELVDLGKEPQLRKDPPLKIVAAPEVAARLDLGNYVAIPLISQQTAFRGIGHIAAEEIEQYVVILADYVAPTGDSSRFRCIKLGNSDRSMSPAIEPEAIIGIDSYQNDSYELDGKLVLVGLEEELCGVRRLRIQGNYAVAIPQNLRDYNPIVLTVGKKRQILGQVVWCFNTFNGKG
jgi:putative transcriptional regulator